MSLTNVIRIECPKCGKVAVEASRFKLGKTTVVRLACGHIMSSSEMVNEDKSAYSNIVFSDGNRPRPYQIEAIKFAERANARCIIADEQGLGKTIESLCLLRLHPSELLPALIVCPSTVKLQWMYEIHRICSIEQDAAKDKKFLTQVIGGGKELAFPGFQIYVATYEMLREVNEIRETKNGNKKFERDVFKLLPEGYIKTIILDECQKIKNHTSERAKAVQNIIRKHNVEHILPMSGTPIKNNSGEYYTVLNLVEPMKFRTWNGFVQKYCDAYQDGWGVKIGGLKDVELFHEDTKNIIIRRTKAEVLPDLPSLSRQFQHVELDRKMNAVYAKLLEELEETYYSNESEFNKSGQKIAIMSKLRHITGLSKVPDCVDFVTEFIMNTDRKITVFVHHEDVMYTLQKQLDAWCADGGFDKTLVMHSGLDGDGRAKVTKQFKDTPSARILIASTLAAGEGLNLQFSSDCIMLERQWNPANEEQAEARFHRFGQQNNVTATYMIATGTIDDFFTELVEIKRSIVAATLDKKEIEWNQQSLMKELAEALVTRGRKAWSI
jgi:SNF2 family DNA or RNA helicase